LSWDPVSRVMSDEAEVPAHIEGDDPNAGWRSIDGGWATVPEEYSNFLFPYALDDHPNVPLGDSALAVDCPSALRRHHRTVKKVVRS
jgi:hypothetical protein